MRAKDMVPGLRVEITGLPFKGRTGVIRGKSRVLLTPVWEVWCDYPDALGRQLVRVGPHDVRPYVPPPAPPAPLAPPPPPAPPYGPNLGNG